MEATKRCPYCGEEVLAVAIKCKHCGSTFDETPAQEPNKLRSPADYGWAILGIPLAGSLLLWFWVTNMTPFQGPMATLTLIVISVVIITGAMCAFEASKLGMSRDPYWGTYSPIQWVFLILLLWVVCYPAYLFKRRRFGVANLLAPGLLVTVVFVLSACVVGTTVDRPLIEILNAVGRALWEVPRTIENASTREKPAGSPVPHTASQTQGGNGRDLWYLSGHCEDSLVKQGSPFADLHNIRGTDIYCDVATLTQLENGRTIVQFVQRGGKLFGPGFAGSAFNYTEGHYALIVDRVYPLRRITGKSAEQIYKEAVPSPAAGYCFFSDSDFSKLTDLSCVTKTESAETKNIFTVAFKVGAISFKRID